MTFLYVMIGIVLFFALLLSIRGRIVLELNPDGELYVAVKVLCFTIQIAPAREPKPIKIKDFTPKKHKKRLRKDYQTYLKKQEKKAKKAAEKQAKKEKKKSTKKEPKEPKRSITDWIDIAVSVLKVLFERFTKHLRIKVARLHVNVATGDAASTAIMYGVVIQSVAYVIEILDRITNIDGLQKADISVNADYLSENMTFDLKFVFSLRVYQIFSILFGVAGKAIKKFFETAPDNGFSHPSHAHMRKKKKKQSRKITQQKPVSNLENKK